MISFLDWLQKNFSLTFFLPRCIQLQIYCRRDNTNFFVVKLIKSESGCCKSEVDTEKDAAVYIRALEVAVEICCWISRWRWSRRGIGCVECARFGSGVATCLGVVRPRRGCARIQEEFLEMSLRIP